MEVRGNEGARRRKKSGRRTEKKGWEAKERSQEKRETILAPSSSWPSLILFSSLSSCSLYRSGRRGERGDHDE